MEDSLSSIVLTPETEELIKKFKEGKIIFKSSILEHIYSFFLDGKFYVSDNYCRFTRITPTFKLMLNITVFSYISHTEFDSRKFFDRFKGKEFSCYELRCVYVNDDEIYTNGCTKIDNIKFLELLYRNSAFDYLLLGSRITEYNFKEIDKGKLRKYKQQCY